jgi:hypothetical protein
MPHLLGVDVKMVEIEWEWNRNGMEMKWNGNE